ncbi:MAG: amino acid ABC transporter substrate-binding protein [Clostridia bacterium]|nr:amino acid ABC transporter substrate-binding protein [Clostridia bacterium]
MKKLIALILVAAMAISACVLFASCGEEQKTLQVYTNAGFAPFEYVNTKGEVVGVDIDIMNYIGKELGYQVVINDIEFKQILNEVGKNELAVGAAGMSKKAERDEVALASDVYATSVQYIIAPVGTFGDGEVVTLEKFLATAAKIGVQAGTTGQYLIEDEIAAEATSNQIFEYSNAIVASQDIGSSIDAVVIDELPAKAISDADSKLACWKIDTDPETYVLYFNLKATDLVAKVNEIIKKMQADGTIDQYIVNHSNGN